MDEEVKKISKERVDWYRNNISECPVDLLRYFYAELLIENEELSKSAIEVAFDSRNIDTELLMRCLLKYNKIKLENGVYTRDPMEWEENISLLGFNISKEKIYCIDDDKIDEYYKALEHKADNSVTFLEIDQIIDDNKYIKSDKEGACWYDLLELINEKKEKNLGKDIDNKS